MGSINDKASALACGEVHVAFLNNANDVTIVRIGRNPNGDIATQLEDAVQSCGEGRTLLDLSGVPHLPACGPRLLLSAAKAARRGGGQFIVFGMLPGAAAAFDAAGLRWTVCTAESEAQALSTADV